MSHLWVKHVAHYICHAFNHMTTLIGVQIFERLWVLVYLKKKLHKPREAYQDEQIKLCGLIKT